MVAMTLNEYAKTLPEDSQDRAYIELYAQTSDFLAAMPWVGAPSGTFKYMLEGSLPGIAFRGINETYTPDYGVENPQIEQTFIAGGELDVDNYLVTLDATRRSKEEAKKAKSMARAITSAFLTGDNLSNPKSPDGLQTRIKGSQIIANSQASGGGALSLTVLDQAIENTVEPTHILMNRSMRAWFTAAMRNQTLAGNLFMGKDEFGKPQLTYNGLPFLVGYEVGPDAKILPFTEVGAGGGTAQCTSLYVLSLKEGHISGIQVAPMKTTDLGEINSAPVHRTRVEWYIGLVIEHPYAATRITSVTNAAIVA